MAADLMTPPATRPSVAADDPRHAVRSLVRGMVVTLGLTALASAGVAGYLAGMPGAVGALVGAGLVLVLFAGSGFLLLITVHRHPTMAVAVLAGGAFVRLALYGATLVALSRVDGIHRPSLAAATGVAIVIALVQELRALARAPRLYWVDATSGEADASSEPRS